MSKLAVISALVADGIKKQMAPNRKYIAAAERAAIAEDAAAVALAVLIDITGGPYHVVQADGDTFTLQHPLSERLTGDLFDCEIHTRIAAGEPLDKGRYRVVENDSDDFDLIPIKEHA